MRKALLLLLVLPLTALAQPAGYYNSALGKNGQQLRQALYNIIKNHNSQLYPLWQFFPQTDKKANGKVWDIYSDIPNGTPPYEYTFSVQQCSNVLSPNNEGDCYNHEHTWPQTYFNSEYPAQSDLFHIYPTDGLVNGNRSNYAYGKVNSASWTSQNGGKLGNISTAGAPSGMAFEPRDEYKGDIARTYFYMSTRYYSEDGTWKTWSMANGAELKPWAAAMLLQWHQADPVSAKEIARNNAIYGIQQNRNPFIDYPQFADCIWGTADCSSLSVAGVSTGFSINVYPNPTTEQVNISCKSCTISIADMTGKQVYQDNNATDGRTLTVGDWAKGVYIIRLSGADYLLTHKLVVE